MSKNVTKPARRVPERARQLAGRLAEAFDYDQRLAVRQSAALDRLREGNEQLWSGLHPDALGLLNDDTSAEAIGEGSSVIAGLVSDSIRFGHSVAEAEAVLLPKLQEVHWTIHRAVCNYQQASEDRRHLAAEIGEASAQLVLELTAVGWAEHEARDADVRVLAMAGAR
ncbi:MAG: hypothetical protein ACYC0H_08365 [Solirubrobacteraceae bacterium]